MERMDIDSIERNHLNQFSDEQLQVINLGKKYNLDTSVYAKYEFSAQKMLVIMDALLYGFRGIEHYVDNYDEGQLSQITRAYKNGYPFGAILDKNYNFIEMYESLNQLEENNGIMSMRDFKR